MSAELVTLYDPFGVPLIKRAEVVITNPKIAQFAAIADEPFRQLGLTVVCLKCKATPTMSNDPGDTQWRMDCPCTTRVLKNPMPRRPS